MSSPEDLAKAIHAHSQRVARRQGGWTMAVVQSVDGTSPPTLTITLAGSSNPISNVRYGESYAPIGGDTVVALVGKHGDVFVIGGMADAVG